MSEARKQGRGRFDGPAGLAIVLLAVVVGAALLERFTRPAGGGPVAPTPLPPLQVEGWLNTDSEGGPSAETLLSRYVVVDCWATHCGPCRAAMPRLTQLYEKWRGRGVEVLGLTTERADRLDVIEGYIQSVPGLDWPVAYGAGLVHGQLGVSMIPTYILFGPDGMAIWRGYSLDALEDELDARL